MNSEITQELLDSLRSQEEKQFVFWLRDAVEAKLVFGFEYEKTVFELAAIQKVDVTVRLRTKEAFRTRHIHGSESYKPDFRIRFTEAGELLFASVFPKAYAVRSVEGAPQDLFIDVKGSYNPYQNDERYFSLVRKVVLASHNIWVEKVIPFQKKRGKDPTGLFVKTWCPEVYRWMKKRKVPTLTAMGAASPTVKEFIATHGGTVDSDGALHTEEQEELF